MRREMAGSDGQRSHVDVHEPRVLSLITGQNPAFGTTTASTAWRIRPSLALYLVRHLWDPRPRRRARIFTESGAICLTDSTSLAAFSGCLSCGSTRRDRRGL